MAIEKVCVFFVLMLGFLSGSMAAVYQVGDAAGWNAQGTDYRAWASNIRFQVGDTLVFFYDRYSHDVREVTKEEYDACTFQLSIGYYDTGNDAVFLSSPGSHYFLCSAPGMCQAGQKVEIRVEYKSSPSVVPPPPPLVTNPTPCTNPRQCTNPPPPGIANGYPFNTWQYGASSSISRYNYLLGFLVIFASSVLAFCLH